MMMNRAVFFGREVIENGEKKTVQDYAQWRRWRDDYSQRVEDLLDEVGDFGLDFRGSAVDGEGFPVVRENVHLVPALSCHPLTPEGAVHQGQDVPKVKLSRSFL